MKAMIITVAMVLSLGITMASAEVPTLITYQGLLTDNEGFPLVGDYSLTFAIYDAETSGDELWSETQASVSVNGGLFKIFLGSVNPITLDFDIPYWIEVQVGSESPQSPRIRLTPAPYSFMAKAADQVDGFDASTTPTANTILPLDATGQFPESVIPSVPPGGTAGGDLTGTYPDPSIASNAVTSEKIQNGEVQTVDIASNAVTAAKIAPNVVSSVDGVSNDAGDIDLVAGANITITPDNGANTITIAAVGGGGGDITGVSAGQGLTGGGTSGDVSLDVGAGTGITVSADAVGLASNYASGSAYDSRFVNEGQNNSVTSAMIVDGTIQQGDLGFAAGDVTAVWSGTGLNGGGSQGDLTLSVENPLELTGGASGVIRGTNTNGNYGYLGGTSRGAAGFNANGNYGSLGSAFGAFGQHGDSGNYGYFGGSSYGGYALNSTYGTYARLGTDGRGVEGYHPNGNYGFVGGSINAIRGSASSGWAGYFTGNVHITGTLSKGGGSFLIDHPLDPENRLLRHNFVESPENLLIYRGKVTLDTKGETVVSLPHYFAALSNESEASIHLTPVGRPFLTGADWNAGFGSFTVYGDPNRSVFWEVLADRDDPVMRELARPVEEEKEIDSDLCARGKLLYPTAYGYPETMSADYDERAEQEQRRAEDDRWSREDGGIERQFSETAGGTRPMR